MKLIPMYWMRARRRRAVHRRHAALRLQHPEDLAGAAQRRTRSRVVQAPPLARRRAGRAARRRRGRRLVDAASARRRWHRRWEGAAPHVHGARRRGGGGRLAVRDHPDVPDPLQRADHRVGEAVHAARAGRARHLHPRGLLQLPLADDPAVPLRDRALRRVLEAGRVRLRPPVPVGLAAHRTGPRARGRASTATSGTCGTWRTRARSRRSSIMPAYPRHARRRTSTSPASRSGWTRWRCSACRTARP